MPGRKALVKTGSMESRSVLQLGYKEVRHGLCDTTGDTLYPAFAGPGQRTSSPRNVSPLYLCLQPMRLGKSCSGRRQPRSLCGWAYENG